MIRIILQRKGEPTKALASIATMNQITELLSNLETANKEFYTKVYLYDANKLSKALIVNGCTVNFLFESIKSEFSNHKALIAHTKCVQKAITVKKAIFKKNPYIKFYFGSSTDADIARETLFKNNIATKVEKVKANATHLGLYAVTVNKYNFINYVE